MTVQLTVRQKQTVQNSLINELTCTETLVELTGNILQFIYFERQLVPHNYFVSKQYYGLTIYTFIPNVQHSLITDAKNFIDGMTEAITRKILQKMDLMVVNNDDEILESYHFKFRFSSNTKINKIDKSICASQITNDIQNLFKNTFTLLKHKIKPLPKNNLRVGMSYQYIGGADFKPESFTNYNINYKNLPSRTSMDILSLGRVTTPFNKIAIKVCAEILNNNNSENTETNPDCFIISVENLSANHNNNNIIKDDNDNNSVLSCESLTQITEYKIKCICCINIRDANFTMIQCHFCLTLQHSECYGIYKHIKIPKIHVCNSCVILQQDSLIPSIDDKSEHESSNLLENTPNPTTIKTDERLIQFTNNELKKIGRMRLSIAFMLRTKCLPYTFFTKITNKAEATDIIHQLVDCSIIEVNNGRMMIKRKNLDQATYVHFNKNKSIQSWF